MSGMYITSGIRRGGKYYELNGYAGFMDWLFNRSMGFIPQNFYCILFQCHQRLDERAGDSIDSRPDVDSDYTVFLVADSNNYRPCRVFCSRKSGGCRQEKRKIITAFIIVAVIVAIVGIGVRSSADAPKKTSSIRYENMQMALRMA